MKNGWPPRTAGTSPRISRYMRRTLKAGNDRVAAFVKAAVSGDWAAAGRMHYELLPLFRALFLETNPIPVKAALAIQGAIEETYRLPMCPMAPKNREKLAATLTQQRDASAAQRDKLAADFAQSKAERLLLAALDYSWERHVVYVAAKPPRSIFRSIAGRLGRSILFVPIGQLSPTKLKRIRVVHVLDSHARREIAKDFIW